MLLAVLKMGVILAIVTLCAAAKICGNLVFVRLAHPRGSDDQDVLRFLDEVPRREVDDLGLGDHGIEGPLEVLQSLGALERCSAHAQVELFRLAALDLVAAESKQKLGVAEVALDGVRRGPGARSRGSGRRCKNAYLTR